MPAYLKFLAGMVGEKYMQKNIREMDLWLRRCSDTHLFTRLGQTIMAETKNNYHPAKKVCNPVKESLEKLEIREQGTRKRS